MTFAKGLGNGFAIGGVVGRGDLLDGIRGNGISTFGGNPIATTAANATLDYVLSHDLQRNAAVTGRIIIDGLKRPREPEDRRRGARQGPDVRRRPGRPGHRQAEPAAGRPDARGDQGARPADRQGRPLRATLRMAPPLTLTEAEAREGLGLLVDALRAVNEEASAK